MSQHTLSEWFPAANSFSAWRYRACVAVAAFTVLAAPASGSLLFSQTNLVTNDQGAHAAQITDSFLQNAWGISHSNGSPFWVSDNATGVATLYSVNPTTDVTTKVTLGSPPGPSGGVVIPPPGAGNPTGQVFANIAGAFNGDTFLFVSEDGTISGWRNALGTTAEVLLTGVSANVYKGTTLDTTGGHSYLLSANFRNGTIDVLKGDTAAPDLTGKFLDPNLPSGYAPFNVQTLGGRIYVTYAVVDTTNNKDDLPGAGHGFVSAFDLQGNLLGRIGTMGTLNSPWGLAIAPSSFAGFAGDLLVGNFGDGTINVFNPDPATPGFLGQLLGTNGNPLAIGGLWGLIPGNDGNGGSSQRIYFSAGPDDERNGLFGVLAAASVAAVPEPATLALLVSGVLGLSLSRRKPH